MCVPNSSVIQCVVALCVCYHFIILIHFGIIQTLVIFDAFYNSPSLWNFMFFFVVVEFKASKVELAQLKWFSLFKIKRNWWVFV